MDRLERIKIGGYAGGDMEWLIGEVERLRQAAQADQLTIQRLRREYGELNNVAHLLRQDHLTAQNEADAYRRERDQLAAENYRLAALTGSMATEVEALTRERDGLRAKLARTKQLAVSLTERPMR